MLEVVWGCEMMLEINSTLEKLSLSGVGNGIGGREILNGQITDKLSKHE